MQASNSNFNDFHLLSFEQRKSTRRRWLVATLSASAIATQIPLASVLANDQPSSTSDASTEITRVKSVLEIKGQVKLKNNRGKSANDHHTAPIEAKSTLEYEEEYRIGKSTSSSVNEAAYQVYSMAELDNLIEKHATKLQLREPCREIVRRDNGGRMASACVSHPLTSAERDIVEGPISTMYLERLLPSTATKIGDSWDVDSAMIAKLFNLELVNTGSLRVTLVEADADTGQLDIKGKIQGEVRSIGTNISIAGKAKIDRKNGIISWLAISLDEEREVSEAEPGFTIQARLRILREKISSISSGQTLSEVEKLLDEANSAHLVQFDSTLGAYRFVADRNWTTYSDSGVDASLRWIQNNRVVAHCTITNMTDMEPGRQLSIEGFQDDIQKSLDKRFGQFLEADERISQTGLRMMRVVTIGQVETVPVQWIHLLLSNDAGRHVILAYSMNATSVETFGSNDLQMAGTLEFTLKQLPVAPSESKPEDAKVASETKTATKPTTTPRSR
ncbi:MAG: hypothetical protein SGI77_23175 [Pirellulaceae bacterium]|nr:hypothetical protein [Pirellulaceae bacterium]